MDVLKSFAATTTPVSYIHFMRYIVFCHLNSGLLYESTMNTFS